MRRAGDAALLVEAEGTAHRLAAAIGAVRVPHLVDVIPGARTVLVVTEPGLVALDELAARIEALPLPPAGSAAAREAEIPVVYDGPDLAEVARLTGLSPGEVIARHAAAEYTVGWMGFSPGFGYLTGIDQGLAAVPRLDEPRLRVPAGSVAVAGGLAAVYPTTSPGGWRLLGRTSAVLWDPDRDPPALFTPGMRVRFRPADPAEAPPTGAMSPLPPATPRPTPAQAKDLGEFSAYSAENPPRSLVEVVRPGCWRPCRIWDGLEWGIWGCRTRARPTRPACGGRTGWWATRRARPASSSRWAGPCSASRRRRGWR